MTVFFALLIFLTEFWIIMLPSKLYINNHSEYTASIYNYTDGLYNLSLINQNEFITATFNEIKDNGYSIKDGEIKANNHDVKRYELIYSYDETNYCVYFVFDIDDSLDEKIANLFKKYYELYPGEINNDGEVDSKVTRICQLAYHDKLIDDKEESIAIKEYHELEDEKIIEKLMSIPYYEFYGIIGLKSNKNYGYCFTKNSVIRSIGQEYDVFSYTFLEFDINDYESIAPFAKDLSVQMVGRYNERLYAIQTFYCIIYILLLPIIFVLIVFLFTRKYGKLKSIFEYYNITSLASIIPAIITGILAFIIGPQARNIYIVLFILYTMFMLIKAASIDNSKEKSKENKE